MSNFLQNGCGESTGDELCTSRPLLLPTSNSVWYVNSATGTDAVSPAGKNREKPLATLAQAITNAQANDIIVLMDGHAESTTSFMTLSTAGVKIVGAGSSGGIPTVTFTFGTGGGISLDGAGNEIRNAKRTSRCGSRYRRRHQPGRGRQRDPQREVRFAFGGRHLGAAVLEDQDGCEGLLLRVRS